VEIGEIQADLNRLHSQIEIVGPPFEPVEGASARTPEIAPLAILCDLLDQFFLSKKHVTSRFRYCRPYLLSVHAPVHPGSSEIRTMCVIFSGML
jgi:hypothetical protein